MPFVGLGIGVGKGGGAAVPTFQFTVDTTQSGTSASDQFTLPLTTSTGLDANVDWGDGTSDNITSHTAPEVTHTYASSGTYTINIAGDLLGWQFNNGGDKLKMGDVEKWGTLNISVDAGFYGCTNMTCTATDAPTITTTSLKSYFRSCSNFNGSIENWDTSSVTNMQEIFRSANLFNQDIGNWDVSNVTNMRTMFRQASSFDQNISNWDINQVSDFTSFMQSATGLSTTNYDALLIDWEANLQAAYPGGVGYPYTISVDFGGSQYTLGSAAETARTSLINNFSWTITDGGGV